MGKLKFNKITKTTFKFYNKKIFFSIGKKAYHWTDAPIWRIEVYRKGLPIKTIESCWYPRFYLDNHYSDFKGPFLTYSSLEHNVQLPYFSDYEVRLLDTPHPTRKKLVGTIKIYYN